MESKVASSHDVKYPRLSEILDNYGFKSVIINLPLTYPFSGISKKENTVIISDWAAPEQKIYPDHLLQKYKEYLIDPPHEWWKCTTNNRNEYASIVKEYTETRLDIYYDLLERVKWDLFFIVFSEIDWLSHIYPEILEERKYSFS